MATTHLLTLRTLSFCLTKFGKGIWEITSWGSWGIYFYWFWIPEIQKIKNTGWNAYSQEGVESISLFSLKRRLNNNTTKRNGTRDEGNKQKKISASQDKAVTGVHMGWLGCVSGRVLWAIYFLHNDPFFFSLFSFFFIMVIPEIHAEKKVDKQT